MSGASLGPGLPLPLGALTSSGNLHLGEFLPPLIALVLYIAYYSGRARKLSAQGRPVPRWRIFSFMGGILLMSVVQVGPLDSLADEYLLAHVTQHILIGDVATFFVVLGLTGPLLQPLLRTKISRLLRPLAHPAVALVLWIANIYLWHLPLFYQLAIRHDLIHALEHACLFWFGLLLWLALLGPLPKPRWFGNWAKVGYVVAVRFAGAAIANAFIWLQTIFYPYYKTTDIHAGLSPLSDQNLAGGIMMIEQILLTVGLIGWLLFRALRQDEQRQQLLDLADDRGVALTDARASRAAADGDAATARLRERVAQATPVEDGEG